MALGDQMPFTSWLFLCVCGGGWILVPQQRRQWHPTPVLLPGKSHGQRSLESYSPWGCEELDTTKRLHFHFSLSCIGEGNSNPLQCSRLENPRDREAWWAATYGVAQSRTRLKWLSSSSSSSPTRNRTWAPLHCRCRVLTTGLLESPLLPAFVNKVLLQHSYLLSQDTFLQRWVIAMDTTWSRKPKRLLIWHFTEKICDWELYRKNIYTNLGVL